MTKKDIIEKDTKLLYHFLKENHIEKKFFKKYKNIKRTDEQKEDFSLMTIKRWININKNKGDLYFESSTRQNSIIYDVSRKYNIPIDDYIFKDFVCNPNLVQKVDFFASWSIGPIVLADSDSSEYDKWDNLVRNFINLKIILYFMNSFK